MAEKETLNVGHQRCLATDPTEVASYHPGWEWQQFKLLLESLAEHLTTYDIHTEGGSTQAQEEVGSLPTLDFYNKIGYNKRKTRRCAY